MDPFFSISLFIFGIIIGSFLNVVILRWNTGMKISKGRSVCFSCGKTLAWHELIPLASFILQKGTCKGCGTKISLQYPLVELASGLAFLVAFNSVPNAFSSVAGFTLFILTAALLSLYIVITVYDMRHKIIPDFFSYAAALVALATIALRWYETGALDLLSIIAGPVFFLFFFFFWFVSNGTWMGLGDAKLALSVGWMLGLFYGISAVLFAFWIGAIASLVIMAVQRIMGKSGSLGMRSAVPFGPFILIGFLLVFIFHIDVQTVLSHLAI